MNIKSQLVKLIIKLTPNKLIIWTANIVLKDIAKFTEFNFDIEPRILYFNVYLAGELEPIELEVKEFAVVTEDDAYCFFIEQAKSNKLWLNTILSHLTQKHWKIPVTAQTKPYMDFIADLFQQKITEDNQLITIDNHNKQ